MISVESLRALYRATPAASPVVPAPPGPRFVVVSCMDRRLRPEECLGLPTGGARVIRNAGGRVSDDVLRSLIVAWSELGAEEYVVLHHTDCAIGKQTNTDLQRAVTAASGVDASGLDFLAFTDPAGSVSEDVARIRECSFIPSDVAVVGFLYDVDHGSLDLIAGDPLSQLPFARGSRARGATVVAPEPTVPSAAAPLAAGPRPRPAGLDLAPLAAPPPQPMFQPPPPATRPVANRGSRSRAVVGVIGALIALGVVVAGIVSGATNSQSSSDQTLPSIDVTVPPITAPSLAPTTVPVPATVAALAPPPASRLAFQDPLSGPSKNFVASSGDSHANTRFANGGLQILAADFYYDVETPGDLRSVTGQPQAATVDVEVTATKVRGGNGNYGVACRLNADASSGYALVINSDRNAEIARWSAANTEQVLAASKAPVDVVNPATSPNIVRGVCTGGSGQPVHLSLIVNGRTVLEATDARSPLGPDGTVGFAVDTGGTNADGSSTTVGFNNLTVRTDDAAGTTASGP